MAAQIIPLGTRPVFGSERRVNQRVDAIRESRWLLAVIEVECCCHQNGTALESAEFRATSKNPPIATSTIVRA